LDVALGPVVVVLGGDVVGVGGGEEAAVVVAVGGDVSGTVGGLPVAVRGTVWVVVRVVVWGVVRVVGEDEMVDALPTDRDPPHPATVKSRAAPKRTAVRLTFAG
jgi:hypothetical protein